MKWLSVKSGSSSWPEAAIMPGSSKIHKFTIFAENLLCVKHIVAHIMRQRKLDQIQKVTIIKKLIWQKKISIVLYNAISETNLAIYLLSSANQGKRYWIVPITNPSMKKTNNIINNN